ncbi:MAG: HD domain-containing protein [Candidatus Krumholzibacteriia bacterium]
MDADREPYLRSPLQRPLQYDEPRLGEVLTGIARRVREAGGTAYLVGGGVRDHLLGEVVRDLDLEVFGLEPHRLQALLERHHRLDLVGRTFGVLKLRGLPVDVSIPRRELKTGQGHRGFTVDADPFLPLGMAARRRDFTVNALYLDPLQSEVVDPVGGLADLGDRVLRHASAAFVEDPLRVLRAMQLAARFEMTVAPETVALCRRIGTEGLARERIGEEWRKLVVRGRRPSRGLTFLRASGWLDHYPELAALVDCGQDPVWHPEGDVWTHTLHALDAFAAERVHDPWEDLVVGLAVLCHDLGKPATTRRDEETERIRSLRHESAGEEPTRSFLARLTAHADLVAAVVPLVRHHLKPQGLYDAGASDAAIRRLASKVGRIDRLVRVARADALGRPPLAGTFPAGDWLLERARALAVADSRPQPLVRGRDLIALGVSPGPQMGALLEELYEAQLDGRFITAEEGLERARRLIARRGGTPQDPPPPGASGTGR